MAPQLASGALVRVLERRRRSLEKLCVLGEEQERLGAQHLANTLVGDATKPEGDDVVGVDARLAKHAKKRKREVLVEKDLHDALRTAGAWCAATWAA